MSKAKLVALGGVASGALGVGAGRTTATVIGTDTRVQIGPSSSNVPYRWIVAVGNYSRLANRSYCSGLLYDSNTVATAGHCVHNDYDGDGDYEFISALGTPTYVSRGAYYNVGGSQVVKPFGYCVASGAGHTYAAHPQWIQNRNPGYDYGAIRVSNPGGSSGCSLPSSTANPADWYAWGGGASTASGATSVAGYPYFFPGQGVVQGGGTVGSNVISNPYTYAVGSGTTLQALSNPGRYCYDVDTTGAQSGSPIIQSPNRSPNPPKAFGIHSYGTFDVPVDFAGTLRYPAGMPGCFFERNGGVAANTDVQNQLASWRH